MANRTVHRDRLGNSRVHGFELTFANDETGERTTFRISDAELADPRQLRRALQRHGCNPPEWNADEHRDVVDALLRAAGYVRAPASNRAQRRRPKRRARRR